MTLFSVSSLTLERGNKVLIRDADFSIKRGRVTVILGPNGVGKSTLLLALAGLYKIKSGTVLLKNEMLQNFSHQQLAENIAWQGTLPPSEFGLKVIEVTVYLSCTDITNAGYFTNLQAATVLIEQVLYICESGSAIFRLAFAHFSPFSLGLIWDYFSP